MITGPCKRPLGKLTKKGVMLVRDALRTVWGKNPELLEPIEGYYDVSIEERLEENRIWSELSY
jgi:4-hydroxy-tetrahydrodipicolinate synthase